MIIIGKLLTLEINASKSAESGLAKKSTSFDFAEKHYQGSMVNVATRSKKRHAATGYKISAILVMPCYLKTVLCIYKAIADK